MTWVMGKRNLRMVPNKIDSRIRCCGGTGVVVAVDLPFTESRGEFGEEARSARVRRITGGATSSRVFQRRVVSRPCLSCDRVTENLNKSSVGANIVLGR